MSEGQRWVRFGGVAGILYVLIAVVAGALTGAAPKADGTALTYQHYFIAEHDMLVLQGWLFPVAAPLLLAFSVVVRRILREKDEFLGDLFLAAQVVVTALVVVMMCLQIAITQAADNLDSQVVFTVGVHFPAVAILMWGFMTAAAALSYAVCVLRHGVMRRWTAYVAVVVAVLCVGSTASVFVRSGPFSPEGYFSAFVPALATVLWYLAVSIALLRRAPRGCPPSDQQCAGEPAVRGR